MKKIVSIIKLALSFALAIGFAACSMMEVEDNQLTGGNGGDNGNGEEGSFLILNFSTATRATNHPFGGEYGDGLEKGHYFENKVDNLCFFIFNDNDKKFTEASDDTPIKFKQYIGNIAYKGTDEDYQSEKFRLEKYHPYRGDRVVVVINVGDVTAGVNKISDLRNATITKAQTWRPASLISNYDSFAMSSCTDDGNSGNVEVNHRGTYDDPFVAYAEVERIAARIDWVLPTDAGNNPTIDPVYGAKYETDGTEGVAGSLYITDIRMVNENQKPTYLIRRIAKEVNPLSGIKCMGKVTLNNKELPNQYVVEPLTEQKHSGVDFTEELLTDWYGASRFSESKNPETFFPTGDLYKVGYNAEESKRFKASWLTEEMDTWCYTVGYTMENTMDKSVADNSDLRTGVQLKCTFVPKDIYVYPTDTRTLTRLTDDDKYQPGRSFCYLEHKDPSKSLFFETQKDCERYLAANIADYNVDDYKILNYVDGVCYYYIWLKHAACDDPNDSGKYPMEYAIVRNNIYRIKIEKILHLGTVEPEDLKYELIKVRQWNLREQPEIKL